MRRIIASAALAIVSSSLFAGNPVLYQSCSGTLDMVSKSRRAADYRQFSFHASILRSEGSMNRVVELRNENGDVMATGALGSYGELTVLLNGVSVNGNIFPKSEDEIFVSLSGTDGEDVYQFTGTMVCADEVPMELTMPKPVEPVEPAPAE